MATTHPNLIQHPSGAKPGVASRRRWPTPREWLFFAVQVFLVSMIQVVNDIIRGNIDPPNPTEAFVHARQVASFEAGHGFFVEPGLQHFFEHSHNLFGLLITWSDIADVSNNVYAFCHLGVTLAVVAWIYVDHRKRFALIRNIFLLANVIAFAGYELFPLAPPRLATGLIYGGHLVHFRDTMRHVLGTGTLNGTPIGYNPFSAMPSLHVTWAIIAGAIILIVAHNPLLRLLGIIYPVLMTVTVVITANHFLLDAVGAVGAAVLATLLALLWQWGRRRVPGRRLLAVVALRHT